MKKIMVFICVATMCIVVSACTNILVGSVLVDEHINTVEGITLATSTRNFDYSEITAQRLYIIEKEEVRPTVILKSGLPDGFAGFTIYISESYALEPWANEGFFQIVDERGRSLMNISQLTQYTTAEEWIYSMQADLYAETYMFFGVGQILEYEKPTSDFNFYTMPRTVASAEGIEMQRFVRCNGEGGIFLISIILFPDEWERGTGQKLMRSLASFEIHSEYRGVPITVLFEDQRIEFTDQQPVIIDGRTLVPVRGVFEQLGFEVSWNPETQQATLTGDDVVIITIGSNVFTTNGMPGFLDVPAQTLEGRTMLPIRHVLESVGFTLTWDGNESTIHITEEVNNDDGQDFFRHTYHILFLLEQDINDIRLAEMVSNGEIPHNVRGLWLNATGVVGNKISDITPLGELKYLEILNIGYNQITDVTPIRGLSNLTYLDLTGNQITNIAPLDGLTNLRYLDLSGNQVYCLEPLAGAPNITNLILAGNQISDITPLKDLPRLERMTLELNQIIDIYALGSFVNLVYLNIAQNNIVDISPLGGLINLETLDLSENQVSDVSYLNNLRSLRHLLLTNNPISAEQIDKLQRVLPDLVIHG